MVENQLMMMISDESHPIFVCKKLALFSQI